MKDFDLRKYLAENKLLKEELRDVEDILVKAGFRFDDGLLGACFLLNIFLNQNYPYYLFYQNVFMFDPKPSCFAYLGSLQDQYLAVVLSLAVLHLCLAANAFLALGFLIFAFKPPEPNVTFLIRFVFGSLTYT